MFICNTYTEADSDYTTVNQALPEFSNDWRRECFFIIILTDERLEDTEQFLVVLSQQAGGTGVTVQPEVATINIVDNDSECHSISHSIWAMDNRIVDRVHCPEWQNTVLIMMKIGFYHETFSWFRRI